MIEPGDRLLAAVSGGSDSTGLALVLHEMRSRLDCAIVVGHVHHGLRGTDADADEAAAARTAQSLGLRFVRGDARIGRGGNVEARARTARYAALHRLAEESGCNRIATGHTLDDQAETFLLRLLRGAGADGLAGIQPVRADGVVRPLLDCDRTSIAAVVDAHGLEVRYDEMNRDPRFLRSRVRHELLPLMRQIAPGADDLCARAADSLRAAAAAQELWATQRLASARMQGGLPLAALADLAADLRRLLLRAWLRAALPAARLTARMIDGVDRIATGAGPGTAFDLTPGWRIERVGGALLLRPAGDSTSVFEGEHRLALGATLELPGGWCLRAEVCDTASPPPADVWTAVYAAESADVLLVRPPRRGERVQPLGMTGHRKLSEILSEHRIPRSARAAYPVIALGDEALWLPGVVRTGSRPVTPCTRQAVRLTARAGNSLV